MADPTRRFSDRTELYVRHRPGYPADLLELLEQECGLTGSAIVADVGSGPGNLGRLFLDHGNPVLAAENMVFFLHMILLDSDSNHAMCFGQTVVVTTSGCESLSNRSMDLVIK